ncbi:hypothetical protein KP005_02480 [Geomonas nitrogeniifigens]|uniref:RiboL-PSP-HEPN domain-containing protein n=1 Tax=Geomonas diazotrophica TaxID=2843197 RepID=A0ABX8JIG0_9BACT|nr:hypothetical protein [Geomonas nitrogeniifigens]QWV98179.1 hypothetical protein KP005_02480 [Geomonas nitrogeniifigens]
MAKKKTTPFLVNVNGLPTAPRLDTATLFNKSHTHASTSAIDTFHIKSNELLTLVKDPSELPSVLGNLLLLGIVSAVESYIREVLRKLVVSDAASSRCCERHLLTYGAAINHQRDMLPESILEGYSFASKTNIEEGLRNILGYRGKLPDDVEAALDDFSLICQMRHCMIHRYGHLGSNNAIQLGLDKHGELFEKPLHIKFDELQQIFLVCVNTVKSLNNFLFRFLVTRSAVADGTWSGVYRKDKKFLVKYLAIFESKLQPPTPPIDTKTFWTALKSHVDSVNQSIPPRPENGGDNNQQ